MKRFICGILVFMLCVILASCADKPDGLSELGGNTAPSGIGMETNDAETLDSAAVSPEANLASNRNQDDVDDAIVRMPGEVFQAHEWGGGFLVQYFKDAPHETLPDVYNTHAYVCFLDDNFETIWEHEISLVEYSFHILGDDGVLIRMPGVVTDGNMDVNNWFALIGKDGSIMWENKEILGIHGMDVAFPDYAGGTYLFGINYHDNYQPTIIHIDQNGLIVSQEPYDDMGIASFQAGWLGAGGTFWLGGLRLDDTWNSLVYLLEMDADLNVLKVYDAPERPFPYVNFSPVYNRILLYGDINWYAGDGYTEYTGSEFVRCGYIYELDYGLNQIHYVEFEGRVPNSVVMLEDNLRLVSFQSTHRDAVDTIRLYDTDWEEIGEIETEYMFTKLCALNGGGFVAISEKLTPGSPGLAVSSVRPQFDTVYQRYNADCMLECEKIYTADESNSGYGYYAYVDSDGRVVLF